MPTCFFNGRKEKNRSSFELASAIAILSFGLNSLELFKPITCNVKIKETKFEIVGREKNLPFGLL
jgi:hypothetical protein